MNVSSTCTHEHVHKLRERVAEYPYFYTCLDSSKYKSLVSFGHHSSICLRWFSFPVCQHAGRTVASISFDTQSRNALLKFRKEEEWDIELETLSLRERNQKKYPNMITPCSIQFSN